MITATATATEMQNNFGRYLNLVMSGQEIIVKKNALKNSSKNYFDFTNCRRHSLHGAFIVVM